VIFVSDEFPGMSCPPPGATNPVYIFMYTENVNAIYNRAVSAGAKVDMRSWISSGETATGRSPTRLATSGPCAARRDVAPEDMKRRQKEAMAAQAAKLPAELNTQSEFRGRPRPLRNNCGPSLSCGEKISTPQPLSGRA